MAVDVRSHRFISHFPAAQGVKLACTFGCDLQSATPYSWPQFSHDAATAAKIESARLQALRAVTSWEPSQTK